VRITGKYRMAAHGIPIRGTYDSGRRLGVHEEALVMEGVLQ
jgi:hypothetical protein